ncbi:MAG: hypothetical protein KF803_07175 [Cyclobacteriaceae bacterium]|nr:hypothetical protein [Cyclobacteriaceae bacterium]
MFLVLITSSRAPGMGEPVDRRISLEHFLATTETNVSLEKWESFLTRVGSKKNQFKDDRQFLEFIFYRTHQVFLKRYSETTSFDEIFTQGFYNCLSGTILYSVILNHFGIEHDVIETNYHIFILAQTSKGEVLLEATDAVDGFVTSADKIQERIEQYQQNQIRNENRYQFSFDLFNKVSEEELIGLLYYNYAVESFNQQNLKKTVHYLSLASERYATARIEEFSEMLLWAVSLEDNLDPAEKQSLKKQLQIIRYKALPAVVRL